ncbi:tyrosine-protein kinase receptor torso isoform X2 [Scaptodrosophila lebanonensis]|uniref:receptor protein-tyrosine kinase n=1 Tax=Drosophila lebanonensis TaxID=7225 RepID=A0A6J2TL97_DROLE|nr:tyrosine-protein kinase receptor torso isoform X2 [Scaptodrosophila lebanonensis]
MLLLYAKYALVFWFLIGSNQGDKQLTRQLSEDATLLGVAACTKRCLEHEHRNIILSPTLPQQQKPQQQQQQQQQNDHFENCLKICEDNNDMVWVNTTVPSSRKIQENFQLQMICRTDSSLMFRIDWVEYGWRNISVLEDPQAALRENSTDALFIVKVIPANMNIADSIIYLSDDKFITVGNLTYKTAYNITVLAVHGNGEYSLIANEETFATLRRSYQPSKMGEMKLRRFVKQSAEEKRIAAEIEWRHSAEHNCFFDIICYSTDSHSMSLPTPVEIRDPYQLYLHTIKDIELGRQYNVGMRTVNPKNSLESDMDWIVFRAPSCVDWFHFNYTICPPLKPTNLTVLQHHYEPDNLSMNISWTLPQYLPDNYTLYILDLHEGRKSKSFQISKEACFYYIPHIEILGATFEVHLVAYTQGGSNVTDIFLNKVPPTVWPEDSDYNKLVLFLIVPLFCIIGLSTFTIWQRKAKLRRYRQRCKYLEAKELKSNTRPTTIQASDFHVTIMDNSTCLDAPQADDNLELEDELEIDSQDVLLQDVLGEGAFGLVRRGIFQKRQVAVKLLKDNPSEEDVQAFKCEIKVLRSVGKHPNIVSIVGYSTKCASRMMLLIEYCGLGNLQNFLREEWKLRQEGNARRMHDRHPFGQTRKDDLAAQQGTRIEEMNHSMHLHHTLELIEEENEDLTTHDVTTITNTVETYSLTVPRRASHAADNKSYGMQEVGNGKIVPEPEIENIGTTAPTSAMLSREHAERCRCRGSGAMRKESSQKFQTITVENKEYFDTEPVQMGMGRKREPLTYADLLDIAQQVAVGMEFLAQNKVVHRDLAARNVLISMDRTIKIADFGLSRDVYHENVYRKSSGGKLPIKWLALESLTHQVYTSQSDVWSFGVLLYEITTLGGMPYPSVAPSDLLQLLRQGQRMKRPEGCPDEMFALMESCWCSIPAQRPTFTGIKHRLTAMILATGAVPQRQKQQQQQEANKQRTLQQIKMQQQAGGDEGHYLQPLE